MAVSISIAIAQNSQNVTNNTSNVTVTVTAKWTNGSNNRVVAANGTPQAKGWVKIDGTSYDFASTFNDNKTTSGSKVVCTKTVDVTHSSDGTKTLSCSASYTTGVSSGTVTASASKALTTIPRKSTLSVGNGTLDIAQTLTVTRQSTSFTHSIKAVCGSSTVYIKADGTTQSSEVKHNDDSISFKPPISWASQNTTGTSVTVKYTITTYNGSTSVGSNTYTKTCSIPTSVKPSCTFKVEDPTGIATKHGGYVKGLSKFKVTVTPTLAYNAKIDKYSVTANGVTYKTASFTTDVISGSGELKISATVTDSRQRSGTATKSVTVLDYSRPTISSITVHRCDASGNDNDQGDHVKVIFDASLTQLNNTTSVAEYYLEYKKTSESEYEEERLSDYDDQYSVKGGSCIFPADTGSSYDVRIRAEDGISEPVYATASASTGYTIMHWSKTGRGMGIGKVSEDGLDGVLDIALMTQLRGGLLYPTLEPGTDLNEIRTPGFYVGENATNNPYRCGDQDFPLTSGTFLLEVLSGGTNPVESRQTLQRLTRCHKTEPIVYERWYYSSSWQDWTGGWLYPTIGSEFTVYASDGVGSKPCCRKDGRLVEVRGIVKPTADIPGGTDMHNIITVPEGYRPNSPVYTVCQGSGNCTWLLRVNTDGAVALSRYRNGDTTMTCSAGAWLPFQVTYFAK